MSDHIEAAIITPDAKPSNVFFVFKCISSFMKNTNAEPKVVPKKGINKANIIPSIVFS